MLTTASAILWIVSISIFLAFLVPCLEPNGEFFCTGVSWRVQKAQKVSWPPPEWATNVMFFCCKIRSVHYFQKALASPSRLLCWFCASVMIIHTWAVSADILKVLNLCPPILSIQLALIIIIDLEYQILQVNRYCKAERWKLNGCWESLCYMYWCLDFFITVL